MVQKKEKTTLQISKLPLTLHKKQLGRVIDEWIPCPPLTLHS